MALPFIKGIARRLSTGGKGETAVVPAQESPEGPSPAAFPGERGKRPSRVGLRAFFGGGDSARDAGEDSVGQLVRQIRAQSDRMSKKELDAKLLEVIHRVDALSPSRVDEVEGWETRLAGMDLRAEAGMLAPPSIMETASSRAVILGDAAASNDVPRLRELSARPSMNVNSADYDARTALHVAASEGSLEAVAFLVAEAKAELDPVDRFGSTPLDDAERAERAAVARFLQSRGARRGADLPGGGATPLGAGAGGRRRRPSMGDASDRSSRDTMSRDFRDSFGRDARDSFGRRDSFERLSGEGATLSRRRRPSRDDLELPSPRSPKRVSGASERSLEDFGADLGAEDGDTRERPRLPRSNSEPRKSFNELQRTVSLWDAAALGDVPLCKDALALLHVDAADYDSRTALHYAAAEGHLDCVRYLVDVAGASTDCLDRYGNTPLSVALRQKRQSCVDALLERGAKLPDTVATPASASANKQVIEAAAENDVDALRDLVARGLKPSVGDYDKRTPLHLAASNGCLDAARFLVDDCQAELNAADRWGNGPLDDALRHEHGAVAKYLEARGARRLHALRASDAGARGDDWQPPRRVAVGDGARRRCAKMLASWEDNDVLQLEKVSNGQAMLLLGEALIGSFDAVDKPTLNLFLLRISSDYGDNPYHSRAHGADALLTTHLLLTKQDLAKRCSPNELLAAYVGAAVHDYSHPGSSNAHEVKVASPLALRYSDDTVLERHHLAAAFMVLAEPRFDVLGGLGKDAKPAARALIIELILMTDLKRHSDFIARKLKPLGPRGHKAMQGADEPWVSPLKGDGVDARLVLTVAIKFADIGHVLKPFAVHKAWTERATEEFWRLGDKEKSLGVAVSPLCDRAKDVDVARSQIGFFKFVCLPFYKVVFDLLDPDMAPARFMRENFWRWLHQSQELAGDAARRRGDASPERALPGIAPAANGRAPLRNSVCVQPGHAAKLASALASPEAPLRRSVQDAESRSSAPLEPLEPKRSFMRRKSSADSVEDRAALSLRSGGSSPSGRDAPRSLVGQALDAVRGPRKSGTSISATPRSGEPSPDLASRSVATDGFRRKSSLFRMGMRRSGDSNEPTPRAD